MWKLNDYENLVFESANLYDSAIWYLILQNLQSVMREVSIRSKNNWINAVMKERPFLILIAMF